MSIKLQRRVAELTKHMNFNPVTSSKEPINAIHNFGVSNGGLCQSPSIDFLTQDEKAALYKQDKLRTSFYKILLFSHIAEAIKAGHLNLLHPYRYKDINEYLIDEQLWMGSEYAARSASINTTCKLQNKSSFNFMCGLLQNYFSGASPPALVAAYGD